MMGMRMMKKGMMGMRMMKKGMTGMRMMKTKEEMTRKKT
jgi:hypothetical protein